MSSTLFVKYSNANIALEVEPDMTIREVKQQLSTLPQLLGVPESSMRLMRGGSIMTDNSLLRDVGLTNESSVHLLCSRAGAQQARASATSTAQQQPRSSTSSSSAAAGGWSRPPYNPLPSVDHELPTIEGILGRQDFVTWCTALEHHSVGNDAYGTPYPQQLQRAVARPRCSQCKSPGVLINVARTSWVDVYARTTRGECFECRRIVAIEYSFVCQGQLLQPVDRGGCIFIVCKSESNHLQNSVLPNVVLRNTAATPVAAYDGEEHLVQLVFHPCGHRMNANDVAAYISANKRAAVVENKKMIETFGKYVLRCCMPNCEHNGIAYLPTCKLAGPQLYNDMKNWGAVEAILEQGGVQCPMEHADGLRAFMPRADEPGPKVFCPSCNFDVCEEHAIPYHACAHSTGLTLRNEITNTMSAGMTQPCPGCSQTAQKDGACTHMTTCPCGTHWCYFCGKAEAQLDISPPDRRNRSRLYRHNDDAENNKNRCVWFLYRHPLMGGSQVESMAKFHRLKLMRLLKELRDARGAAEFDPVYESLPADLLVIEVQLDREGRAAAPAIRLAEIQAYPPHTSYALP
jgi:hypothetical protein